MCWASLCSNRRPLYLVCCKELWWAWAVSCCAGLCLAIQGSNALKHRQAHVKLLAVYAKPWCVYTGCTWMCWAMLCSNRRPLYLVCFQELWWAVLCCAGLCLARKGSNALKHRQAHVKLLAEYAKPWSVYTGISFKTQACTGPTRTWNSLKESYNYPITPT